MDLSNLRVKELTEICRSFGRARLLVLNCELQGC
jgi:hypothetical protein